MPLQNKGRWARSRQRRTEIRSVLESCSLPQAQKPDSVWEDHRAERLANALQDPQLGPVFSCFGLYLSARADLMKPRNCLALSAIADSGEAMPADQVRRMVSEQLGTAAGEIREIRSYPLQVRLRWQSHEIVCGDGRRLVLQAVRPGLLERAESEVADLRALQDCIPADWANVSFEGVCQEFLSDLRRRLDMRRQAEALAALDEESEEVRLLASPQPVQELSGSRILTVVPLQGTPLAAFQSAFSRPGLERFPGQGLDTSRLGRFLCLAWLRQLLEGRFFPADPWLGDTKVLNDSRIAFTQGPFESMPPEFQRHLKEYLFAAARHDPDQSSAHLVELARADSPSADLKDLRHWVRQVAPLRDGGWDLKSRNDSAAEFLFVQWKLLTRHGFQPRPQLISFYRGLFRIAAMVRQLEGKRDLLLEAIEDLRLSFEVRKVENQLSVGRLAENLGRMTDLMASLPVQLDQAIDRINQGSAFQARLQDADGRRRDNSHWAVAALLVLLAATVILARHAAASGLQWWSQAAAVVFTLIGGALLWVLWRK